MTDTTRDEMVAKLCIRDDGLWLSGRGIPKLFVTVGGPADKYTDAELALLVPFTAERQAAYHVRCGSSKLDWADNFISFDKDVDGDRVRWGRKRYSWREGRMHAASLPEAIATFWGDRYRGEQIGDFCLLGTGEIVEVLERIPYDRDNEGDFTCRRLVDGAEVLIKQHVVGVVSIHARSIEALGEAMRMAMDHRIANRRTGDVGEGEMAAARAATTATDDPQALTDMWAARVLDWFERDRPLAA